MPLSAANIARLEHVLAPLNPTTSAAEVRADGFLWIRTTAQGKWHRMARMRGHEVAAARAWVAAYMARNVVTPANAGAPTTHEPAGA